MIEQSSAAKGGLRLEWRSPHELAENPKNWRRHPETQLSALSDVISEVGWAGACLYNERTGRLIDGHARRKVALEQGTESIPVLVGDWDEATEAKILATLDPLAAMAETDGEALNALLAGLETDSEALQGMLDDLGKQATLALPTPEVQEDDVPEPPAEPVTKPGDLWVLGEHRLLCGDSTSSSDVERLLDGRVPFIMVTDPPYGVEYDPHWRHDAGINSSKRTGKVSNDDRADWTTTWRLFAGNIAYVWHGGLHSATVHTSLMSAGFVARAQIVWVKPRLVISRGHYHWQHEPAFHCERPTADDIAEPTIEKPDIECEEAWYAARKGTTADWVGGRKQTTVWEIGFKDGTGKTVHGTQKPVECMARPIRNHGGKDDDVYDPFLGSGTTLIACEQLGRKCYGIEISPTYCDVIVQRWENLTGKKAILEKG
jgi:DNA modification methylase